MKLKLIAVAALVVSAGAHADTTFELGTLLGTAPIGNSVSAGVFTDSFNFDVASASTATAIALNTSYLILPSGPSLGKVSFFAGSLDSVPLVLDVSHDTSSGVYDLVTQTLHSLGPVPMLAVGNPHTLTIHGTGDATSGSYTGSLSVTAVPEPETYALMLAGLGAIGFLARRRQQT